MPPRKLHFDFSGNNAILLYISLFKFILLLLFAGNYGLFRDEYYYIECSKHLDWGYVDQPPMSILILAFSRTLFGDSILGIRLFAYLAGSITIFISGLIARELGGGRFSQVLTALSVIFCAVVLGTGSYFSMNAFDVLFASIIFYLLTLLINNDNPKIWIWLGLVFGISLENKLTPLFLVLGLLIGLIPTKQRKYFLSKELYIGVAIALLIFLPHIIWQIAHKFLTLEFMRNATLMKNVSLGFLGFLFGSITELNPLYIFYLIFAFLFLLFNKAGKKFALIAWIYFAVFIVFVLNNGKPYYMGILYPAIIAAGIVGINALFSGYSLKWLRYLMILILVASAGLVTPFAIPILKVDTFIHYSETLSLKPASGERSRLGVLPQFYADRFGWKDMVEKVALAYNKLSEDEKKKVLIFGQNYGEASAVNYYRNEFGLPRAVSSHNSFWLWGFPKDFNGDLMIVIGSNLKDNSKFFEKVELAASHSSIYGMPYENVDIFICRKLKILPFDIWNQIKMFI
jgi:MFS family permease